MSEEIINRREARRRKILENAKGRLEKLCGEDSEATIAKNKCNNHTTEKYEDPEINHPEFMTNYNSIYTNNRIDENIPNHLDWNNSTLLNPTMNNLDDETKPPTKLEKLLSTRMHIFAASPLTYLLLTFGIGKFVPNILFLYVALECLELLIFRLDKSLSPMQKIVLLLCGIDKIKAKIFITTICLFNRLVCDLGLFIFSFVVSHALYCWLVGDRINEMFNSF